MATYTLIASQEIGSGGASSVTFSDIPQTYTDLLLRMSTRMSGANGGLFVLPNNNTSSAYSCRRLLKDVSSPVSDNQTSIRWFGFNNGNWSVGSVFSQNEYYMPDYSASNGYYRVASTDTTTYNDTSTQYMGFHSQKLNTTSAITSIVINPEGGGTFLQYSGFYLYGISKA